MRIKGTSESQDVDVTSMIDIVFLLIAFFIFLINFSDAEQDQRIKLPKSELAIPSKVMPVEPLTLQMTVDGTIVFNNEELAIWELGAKLSFEKRLYEMQKIDLSTITVLLRADGRCEHKEVMNLKKECQLQGFSHFKLIAISESAKRY